MTTAQEIGSLSRVGVTSSGGLESDRRSGWLLGNVAGYAALGYAACAVAVAPRDCGWSPPAGRTGRRRHSFALQAGTRRLVTSQPQLFSEVLASP